MNAAQLVNGTIVAYPYLLRPTAKKAHPEVSPLPGSWEQCSPEQLAALECVEVQLVARPELQAGESCAEGTPEFVGGQWRQTWVVTAAPEPPVPESVPAYHLRRALRAANKLSVYKTFVSALTDEDAKDYWETANPIKRNSRYMPTLRAALSITNNKLDDIFIAAGNMADT